MTSAHVLRLRLAYVGLSHDHWIRHGDKNAVAALPWMDFCSKTIDALDYQLERSIM